jgi:tetratricopeptide (TPR) repeat protein
MKIRSARDPRPFLPPWFRWHEWLTAAGCWLNSSRWEGGYVVLLLGFVLVYQLASPIVLGDTDMWYHLNGGRYFWEHGEVPTSPFFSFNDPERTWINYYWGFQALVFKVHELAGYQGLVVLRALLVFAGLVTIWRVIAGFRQPQTAGLALLVLLAIYVVLVDGRAYQLRPHLVSYFFIPLFIYVLEHRPRLAPLLPVVTVVWANAHGVEWVVGALICGAYLFEFLVGRRRGQVDPERGWWYAAGITTCLPALLLNPHGSAVFVAPFVHPADLTQYVNEMRPLSWEALSTFATQSGQVGAQSAFALLFVFSVYAAVASLVARRGRVSHLMLLAGGLVLLSRGTRFIWEWALMALPLLGAQAAIFREGAHARHAVSPGRAIGLALLLVPLVTLGRKLDTSKPYPFDAEGLPVGTSQFLRDNAAKGNLLMNPSLAGYSQWTLGPDVRVFADMELPPFNDWDMYRIFSANQNAEAFKRLLGEYPIDFVLVELRSRPMAGFVKDTGEFAPVFFDDSAVLYAHRQRKAGLVVKHELKAIDPFNLLGESNLLGEKRSLDERLLELEIARDLFPTGNRTLHALTRLLVNAKRYAEAEKWADRFLAEQPRDPNAHLLKGVILENTDRCSEAIANFENAFPISGRDFHPALHQHLGSCHYLMKDFSAAYAHFNEGVNIYLHPEASETLYQYAFSAVIAGDSSRARMLLNAILYQTPEKDELVLKRARGLLAQLDSDPSLSKGLIGSLVQ